jgi:predicted ABC-type ATPase
MRLITLAEPLKEGIEDFGSFKAVFMAGSPGSGKSTVRSELFGGLGLKVVDADEIRGAYLKMGKAGDYDVFGDVVRRQRQSYMDQRLGIIMDTTAWWLPGVRSTTEQLRELGYDVGMVHVFTPLHVALERVRRRAAATGREVPEDEVVKRFEGLKHNIGQYTEMFGDNYWFVDNSSSRPRTDPVKRDITRWLRSQPINPRAREWISQQRAAKRAPPLEPSSSLSLQDSDDLQPRANRSSLEPNTLP